MYIIIIKFQKRNTVVDSFAELLGNVQTHLETRMALQQAKETAEKANRTKSEFLANIVMKSVRL